MNPLPAHPAWNFVTRLYAAPDVAPACMRLQRLYDIDVTLMLFCLWRGSVCEAPLAPHLPNLMATAATWRISAVLPIRQTRMWLKAESASDPTMEGLYQRVLTAEIECEQGELLALTQHAEALCEGISEGPFPAVMAANLSGYLHAAGIAPTEADRADMALILTAARG
ncbi:TIGR02444 family protein [Rhizobium sp. YJ-22]|uniref:TIGR02444 family protein n=1 Tax=Rhizobium sp. YJ-22 TaxID=3037556 RepID=UPI002412BD6D|nr:TIGR02444 family protein [Rhizobium sp. YJ-22]MDG3578334.1 TIGR02444 family protein [Rhizobium sp. YJ-22]